LLKYVDAGLIEFRQWDSIAMLEKAFEGEHRPLGFDSLKKKLGTRAKDRKKFGDLVRFLLLKIYGGLYVDANTILLRDMSDLYNAPVEFSYQWSFYRNYNTAILRMWRNSTTLRVIMEKALANVNKKHPKPFNPMIITKYLAKERDRVYTPSMPYAKNPKLFCFPSAVFDPLWLKVDGMTPNDNLVPNLSLFSDVFNAGWVSGEVKPSERGRALREWLVTNPDAWHMINKTLDNEKDLLIKHAHLEIVKSTRLPDRFYRGAYAYHWHKNWDASIPPSSWMGIMLERYNQFLDGDVRNIYGETFGLGSKQDTRS